MALNRKIILVTLLFLSLGICYRVTSFSDTKVKNNVNYMISSSENALIAIPDDILIKVKKVITTQITYSDKKIEGNESTILKTPIINDDIAYKVKNTKTIVTTDLIENNFTIKNNIERPITVKIFTDQELFLDTEKTILSGGSWSLPMNLYNDIESSNFNIVIKALWDKGKADINKMVNVLVDTELVETIEYEEKEIVTDKKTKE